MHQIPVQEFKIEAAQKTDRDLQYSLNNMAPATYAKLNGIPWLLKANPTIAHELVIGLGSANVSESRLGNRERYVGHHDRVQWRRQLSSDECVQSRHDGQLSGDFSGDSGPWLVSTSVALLSDSLSNTGLCRPPATPGGPSSARITRASPARKLPLRPLTFSASRTNSS